MSKLGKEETKWSFLSLIKLEKDKLANSGFLPSKSKTKNMKSKKGGCSG